MCIVILVQKRNSHGSFKLKILIKRLLYLYHLCQEKKLCNIMEELFMMKLGSILFYIYLFSYFSDFRFLHYIERCLVTIAPKKDSYELFLDNVPFSEYYNTKGFLKN